MVSTELDYMQSIKWFMAVNTTQKSSVGDFRKSSDILISVYFGRIIKHI